MSRLEKNRGAFIVFEGCDRCGKSTQSKLLVSMLENKNIPVKSLHFPERDSKSGQIINSYLKNAVDLPDECIHLMFSINRWELNKEIKKLLESGITLVVDRYSYSGIAYSSAKGLDFNWCKAPEKGLIQPDIVFYLKSDVKLLTDRNEYGDERYEKLEFQQKVSDIFDIIYSTEKSFWQQIDAHNSLNNVHEIISKISLEVIHEVKNEQLKIIE